MGTTEPQHLMYIELLSMGEIDSCLDLPQKVDSRLGEHIDARKEKASSSDACM